MSTYVVLSDIDLSTTFHKSMLSIIRGGAQSGRGWKLFTSKDHDLQTLHLSLVYYLFKK